MTGSAGAVGGYALGIARDAGWAVTGFAREADAEFVTSQGASSITELTGSYDAVLDATALGEAVIGLVVDGGRYAGFLPGAEPSDRRGITISAVYVEADGARLAELLQAVGNGTLPARVSREVPFADAGSVTSDIGAAGQRGRIVITA